MLSSVADSEVDWIIVTEDRRHFYESVSIHITKGSTLKVCDSKLEHETVAVFNHWERAVRSFD
jgi:hypothetical protein